MESVNFNRINRWKKRHIPRSPFLTISFFTLLFSLLFFISYKHISNSFLPVPDQFRQCSTLQTLAEKFMWYAPHSGFSNQLSEFKNALLLAAILNRTLIVPPILDHHAVALGSCPKFRVSSPKELRIAVWNHMIELIHSRRYVSLADIIDLSSVVSISAVRIIDFRIFASIWCDVSMDLACPKDSNSQAYFFETLRKCGSPLSGYDGNIKGCFYAVDNDCRTTVWIYQKEGEDGSLDSFQPDEQLKRKKKISFIRKKRDVYKTLGPGSEVESASVLGFGSLFTSQYKGSESHIDIHEAPKDQRIQSLIKKIEFLPFVPEITSAGKEFAHKTIKSPFLCAQLRLLDGQFKNHWESTFFALKQKLESLQQKGPFPIHIFVMTDLPAANWTGSYLGDLDRNSEAFKLFVLREEDELVINTAKKLVAAERGIKSGSGIKSFSGVDKHCSSQLLPDVLLYVEETVCSCASLGFVGTAGSTIADSIELMRRYDVCSV